MTKIRNSLLLSLPFDCLFLAMASQTGSTWKLGFGLSALISAIYCYGYLSLIELGTLKNFLTKVLSSFLTSGVIIAFILCLFIHFNSSPISISQYSPLLIVGIFSSFILIGISLIILTGILNARMFPNE